MSEVVLMLDTNASTLSEGRLQYMIKRFRELGLDTVVTNNERNDLQTQFSEEYSQLLKLGKCVELDPGELLVYNAREQVEEAVEMVRMRLDDNTIETVKIVKRL